ncbi:MAG: type I glyceraldehyde-3-phosphate dehydrogenase, partial [Alkalibacterium sp.]|nr:type I glyceraldehyde-3-phosphate dehydrogenase [Alkalibacterium sp.]
LGIDIVLESTGFYVSKEASQAHLDAGAKRVLISAPAKGDLKTIVYGVNHEDIEANDTIVSAASCTTNCLAPMVNVLNKEFGIDSGLMSTIHAYTSTQSLQDSPGGRKSRAAAQNAIPASTGAAKAVGKVIPEVDGKIDGTAVRIPTVTGSMTELYSVLDKKVTEEEVNEMMKKYSSDAFVYNEDEIVSSDIIGMPAGSVFDSTLTKVIDGENGQLVKTVAWYDNEYGFTGNMVRTLEYFAGL